MPRELQSTRYVVGFKLEDTGKGARNCGHIRPDMNDVKAEMDELTSWLDNKGWEIKTVVPLTGSYYEQEFQKWSSPANGVSVGGYGYGAPYTSGVIVLAQRWVDVTQEELDDRERARVARLAAEQEAETERQRQARQAEIEKLKASPVKTVGLFKSRWRFEDEDYETVEAAEAAKAARLAQLEAA